MRRIAFLYSLLFALAAFLPTQVWGQNSLSYLNDLGGTSYGVNIPVENGFINVSNGNLHLEFPLASNPQRGALSLSERLTYDSRIWEFSPFGSHASYHWWPYNVPGTTTSSAGWQFVKGNEIGTPSYTLMHYPGTQNCINYGGDNDDYETVGTAISQIIWTDPSGTVHPFNANLFEAINNCTGSDSTSVSGGTAADGSGYSIQDDGNGNPLVIDNNGTQVYPQIIDRYGNYWSSDGQGNLMDSAGRVPVITTQNGNVTYYDVLAPSGPINNNGTRVRYTVTTASISTATNFGQSDVYEWTGPYLTPVQSIGLPDGSQYSFTYDSYGGLTSMTLPTGGTIQYGYSNFVDSSNTANRWLTSHTLGSDPPTTFTPSVVTGCSNYSTGCVEQVTMHKPSGDENVYQLTLNNGAWNTVIETYTGTAANGQQISQTANTNTYTSPCSGPGCYSGNYLSQTLSTTTLSPSGLQSQTQSSFNATDGKPSAVRQWDFIAAGQGFPSIPNRETDYAYTGHDLSQTTTVDQSGQRVSQTTYSYTTSATATSGIVQHGTANAGGPYLQKVSQWLDTTGSMLDQTLSYDDTGTVLSSADPNGTTSYGHDGTNVFVTSVTPPTPSSGVSLTNSATYDANSGVLLTQTDPNGVRTVYSGFDALSRPTEIDVQDSNSNLVAKSTYVYSINQLGVHRYQNSNVFADTETQYDAYGRPSRTAVNNGQSSNPWYQQDTCYDSSGRPNFQATAYQGNGWSTAQVCSGNNAGTTTNYDALGRPSSIVNADGTTQYSYAGRAVKTTDVNGVQIITQMDAFGRTTAVCEISTNSLAGESPASCGMDIAGTGFVTTYSYDLAQHTTTITQGNRGSRTFRTDSIGRLADVHEPERGETAYSYMYNGTGLKITRSRPKANQGDPHTGTYTTTQYDSLGRVVSVNYDDGLTPAKLFSYDQATAWGGSTLSLGPSKGRLTEYFTQTSPNPTFGFFIYNNVGNIVRSDQCLPSGCGSGTYEHTLQYSYDLTGNVLTADTGASGVTTVYTYSPAGEVQSINSNANDASHPPNLVSNIQNGPFGPITYHLGNRLSTVRSYDVKGRNVGGWLCNNSTQQGCTGGQQIHGYAFSYAGTRLPGSCDTLYNQCASYGYDEFNRLTSQAGQQGRSYSYDRYGNRVSETITSGSAGTQTQFSFNVSNQIVGYSYDAAGNLTGDGLHSYTYDAEGNLLQVDGGSTAINTYDAFNRRVRIDKGSDAVEFLFNPQGQRTAFFDGYTFASRRGQYYWGSSPIAYYTSSTHFQHLDWLGTERVQTDVNGAVEGAYPSLPFGEDFNGDNGSVTYGDGTSNQDAYHFAGLDHDFETNTDHAMFRQYSPGQGRWMSPDPYDGSMDLGNPQSLNRYAYVGNNPLSFSDPSGLIMLAPGDGGSDDCEFCDFFINIGQALGSLFGGGHAAFHGSTTARPGGTSGLGQNADGTYTISAYANLYTGSGFGDGGFPVNYGAPFTLTAVGFMQAPNNLTPPNPCLFQGNAMSPGQYAAAGAAASALGPAAFLGISGAGFPRGSFLDAQPRASGNVFQRAAYGNYSFGVYMASAGVPYAATMATANAFAMFSHYTAKNGPMDSTYTNLPNANVVNITNGFNAARSGTTCHR